MEKVIEIQQRGLPLVLRTPSRGCKPPLYKQVTSAAEAGPLATRAEPNTVANMVANNMPRRFIVLSFSTLPSSGECSMVSFPALPGRYHVMTPKCWPGTCWKATGTSPVNALGAAIQLAPERLARATRYCEPMSVPKICHRSDGAVSTRPATILHKITSCNQVIMVNSGSVAVLKLATRRADRFQIGPYTTLRTSRFSEEGLSHGVSISYLCLPVAQREHVWPSRRDARR
jgi:hypothetical protein